MYQTNVLYVYCRASKNTGDRQSRTRTLNRRRSGVFDCGIIALSSVTSCYTCWGLDGDSNVAKIGTRCPTFIIVFPWNSVYNSSNIYSLSCLSVRESIRTLSLALRLRREGLSAINSIMPLGDAEVYAQPWELYVIDMAGIITTASASNPQVSSVWQYVYAMI